MAKKTIMLTLYVSELVYDIQNKTYLTGRSRRTGANHEEVANMQANDDDENANQILRSIQNTFGTLKTKLTEWLNDDGTTSSDELMAVTEPHVEYYRATVDGTGVHWDATEDSSAESVSKGAVAKLPTDGVSSGDVYTVVNAGSTLQVELNMPSNYNNSTRDAISAALHQFIVNTAIGDWFTITDKADASDYFALATNNLETIREAANKRIRPQRQVVS